MKPSYISPQLETALTEKITELEREDSYLKNLLFESNPQSSSSSVDLVDQYGVTIPQYIGMGDTFITNPSNVGVGIIARMIETDPTILSSVQFKTMMMLAKVGEYQNEDKKIADFVRDFLSKMYGPTFKESLEAQASKFGYGFSISEIIWGLNKENLKVPQKVKTYHPSTICFEVDPCGEITEQGIIQFVVQNMQYSNPNNYVPSNQYGFQVKNPFTTPEDRLMPYRMPFISNYGLTRIPKSKVVHHTNSVGLAFGSPYGKAAVRTAHLAWQLKVFFQKQMGIAGKRQASPFIWATAPRSGNKTRIENPLMPGMKGFVNSGLNNPNYVDMNPIEALSSVLRNRQNDDSIVTGPESEGYKIEAIAANMDLNQYLAVLNWLDVQIFRSFLLPSLVMTDGSGGSRALGDKHFQIVDRIAEEDALTFTQTVVDQLVRPAISMNFGEQDNYGHFAQRPQNIEERERLSSIFVNLANAGYMKAYDPVDGAYVRSTLHLPEQEESFYAQPMPNLGPLDDPSQPPEPQDDVHGKPGTEDPSAPQGDQGEVESKASAAFNGAQVTAVVNVVTSVSKGEIPLQTGIEILKSMFGFSDEQATRLLPSDIMEQVAGDETEAKDIDPEQNSKEDLSMAKSDSDRSRLMGIKRTVNYQGFSISIIEGFDHCFSFKFDRNGMSTHTSSSIYASVESATNAAKQEVDRITRDSNR